MLIVYLSFGIISAIPILIARYNSSLENSLSVRQPHLIVTYFDSNKRIDSKELKIIEDALDAESEIVSFNTFVEKKLFVSLQSYGNNLSEYNGFVKIIAISTKRYNGCYYFDMFRPLQLEEYGFKLTGID